MAIFVRNDSPLKFKMRVCSQRMKIKELVLGGGGIFVENEKVDDEDVMDIVPNGGRVFQKKSVAAQFVTSSAVRNQRLKLDLFLLDGSSVSNRAGGKTQWSDAEEVSLIEWLLRNDKSEKVGESTVWKELIESIPLRRSPTAASKRFWETIRPKLGFYSEMIDPLLADKLDQLGSTPKKDKGQEMKAEGDEAMGTDKGLPAGSVNEVNDPMDIVERNYDDGSVSHASEEPAVTPLARRLNFEAEEGEEEETFIDVVGFTQTQFPNAMTMEVSSDGVSPPIVKDATQPEPLAADPASKPTGEVVNQASDLSAEKNDESKRLESLKTPLSRISAESSILLSNRCVGTSSRVSAGNAPSDVAMDSFGKLFQSGPSKNASQPSVKQAETLDEVVHELSSYYDVTPEVATKALKDAGYSVKKAICLIIRGITVETITQCHRLTR